MTLSTINHQPSTRLDRLALGLARAAKRVLRHVPDPDTEAVQFTRRNLVRWTGWLALAAIPAFAVSLLCLRNPRRREKISTLNPQPSTAA